MKPVAQLLSRLAWAVGGLHEEIVGSPMVKQWITQLHHDPREVLARQACWSADWRAQVPERWSARELEQAGQLTLFPLPVVPHLATQRGFSLAGMQVHG